jgi:hypothetical protein
MLIWGTANPEGCDGSTYNGLFLTERDIDDVVQSNSMQGLPLKVEHTGVAIGKVITAWKNQGKLDLLCEVDKNVMEGDIATRFVHGGITGDFSLGYSVEMAFSDGSYRPTRKLFKEVSLVRKGARDKCHIHAYTFPEEENLKEKVRSALARNAPPSKAWAAFMGHGNPHA